MEILLAVAALSVCALLGATFAVARHIRKAGTIHPHASAEATLPLAAANPEPTTNLRPSMLRKQPQRAQREDWAHFNKDFGDLSDPYQHRPRVARR